MKISRLILYIFSTTLIYSCGVDRTYEFEEMTNDDKWIEGIMQEHYLWYDNMSETSFDDYFATADEFLQTIMFKGSTSEKADQYSYVVIKDSSIISSGNYIKNKSTYGFDFELLKDPTQTTAHTLARVLYVLPNSPAYEAGLKRGDWISEVMGERVTNDNYAYLMDGYAKEFTVRDITSVDGEPAWINERKIEIQASRKVENDPFFVDTTYTVGGKKIAYLVYNKFSTGPDDNSTDTEYLNEMKLIFSKFKGEAPSEFILDLRYNTGGYLTCAQELASMLAPSTALGKTFLTLKYNNKTTPQNVSYDFINDLSAYNLNLKKIYILTSSFTASASEAVINCLKPYMGDDNVIIIGEKTVGKNVALEPFTTDNLKFVLWPVVAYVLNSNGSGDYSTGINPTYAISERSYSGSLLPLGDINELLLKNTISLITSGTMPDYTMSKVNVQGTSELKSSISLRNPIGFKIK